MFGRPHHLSAQWRDFLHTILAQRRIGRPPAKNRRPRQILHRPEHVPHAAHAHRHVLRTPCRTPAHSAAAVAQTALQGHNHQCERLFWQNRARRPQRILLPLQRVQRRDTRHPVWPQRRIRDTG